MTRIAIEIEALPCTHPNARDYYHEGDSYPRSYRCPDCGSMFPTVGDTDLWAEGVKLSAVRVNGKLYGQIDSGEGNGTDSPGRQDIPTTA